MHTHCFDDINHTLISAQLRAWSIRKIQHDRKYMGHWHEGETEQEELSRVTKLSVVTSV